MGRREWISRRYVGVLCVRGHEHERTGGSLRNGSGNCVACAREKARERYQREHPKDRARLYRQRHKYFVAKRRLSGVDLDALARRYLASHDWIDYLNTFDSAEPPWDTPPKESDDET